MTEAINLGEALDTVITRISEQFSTFKTVAAEDENRKELQVPAIILQLSGIEPEPTGDLHTGQFPARVLVEARVIMGHRTPTVRREVIKAAGALATFIHNNRMGVRWGPGVLLTIEPDEFAPVVETHDVWFVEWSHQVDLGESYFVDDATTPTEVLTSFAPEIGTPNEADYESLELRIEELERRFDASFSDDFHI